MTFKEKWATPPEGITSVEEIAREFWNAALDEAAKAVAGVEMLGPSPIGPLHGSGWNAAQRECLTRVRYLKEF